MIMLSDRVGAEGEGKGVIAQPHAHAARTSSSSSSSLLRADREREREGPRSSRGEEIARQGISMGRNRWSWSMIDRGVTGIQSSSGRKLTNNRRSKRKSCQFVEGGEGFFFASCVMTVSSDLLHPRLFVQDPFARDRVRLSTLGIFWN